MRSPKHHPKVGVAARMLRSPPPPRLKVVDLNPHLSCILCGGYFIDATTITECLHSFCRACIVRYLETSEYCPVCEVQVHKSKPLRSDKILQDIVYKLVPGLFHNEMKRRRELYASQPPEALKESRDAEDRGECLDQKFIYAPDEIFSLSIEYGKEVENKDSTPEEDNAPKRRFLRCPAAVTISHLKKFVRMKYGISNAYEVDLKYDKETLRDDYTLIDVAYIFLWKRRGPMRFFYKIVERPPRKPKSEHVFMEVSAEAETGAKEPEKAAAQDIAPEPAPVQSVVAARDKEVVAPTPPDKPPAVPAEPAPVQHHSPCESEPSASDAGPVQKPLQREKDVAAKDPVAEEAKTECKSIPFKFPPVSLQLSKSGTTSDSSSKPAVMTVAPLTKPSASLPTTSTSPTITHGTYTGISIKKSPPNTLPPFKISSHLLTPKVPPLKLSPPRFSKLENCLRELKKSSASSRKSKSSRGSSDKLELKVAQLKSSASSVKCVAPLVITVPPEAKLDNRMRDSGHCALFEKKPEVKSPTKAAPVEIKSPSKSAQFEIKIPTKAGQFDIRSPSRAGQFEIKSPTKANQFEIKSPSKAGQFEIKSPTKAPQFEIKSPTKATQFEIKNPTRIAQFEIKSPTAPLEIKSTHKVSPVEIKSPTKALPVEPKETTASLPPPPKKLDSRATPELDDKMDLDSDLFEGPLVIAEPPDMPQKDDSNNSDLEKLPPGKEVCSTNKPEDSEDEEIDVVDDGEADSGRGSDVSSRTEARSLCGFDDDLGSPDSVPKTPEAERTASSVPNQAFPNPKSPTSPKINGAAPKIGNDCGVLDLSTCGRKRSHDGDMPIHHRAKQVANPAVLDKTRQTSTPCISPNPTPFKVIGGPELSHHISGLYGKASKHESSTGGRGNFKCRGNTLTVINPDPNGSRPKIVIRNLGPRPDRGHERFHHHHHHHHNHHQRM